MRSAITFDIDWAPDWCVRLCRDICAEAGAPATFFATHASAVLEELRADPRLEVGIHPNFATGSSHGANPVEVIAFCLELVPGARIMRTHGLVQSTEIFRAVLDRAPGIDTDVSLFLPFHDRLAPSTLWLGGDRGLRRLPYYWEDDVAPLTPGWRWDAPPPESGGLRIFDFHPIHVALNMAAIATYDAFKRALGRPLATATPEDVGRYQHEGQGARTFLRRVLATLGPDLAICSALDGRS